jgi:hypothetical protein
VLTTGETKLNHVLRTYGAVGVLYNSSLKDQVIFLVTFDASLNIRGLVSIFQSVSKNIISLELNGYLGKSNEITFEQGVNQKKYVFSHGWGDCPAGCIEHHLWTVTIASDGSITLLESGDPILPQTAPHPIGADLSSTDTHIGD